MVREIGGYLELERFTGSLFHEGALALGSGRACLRYLIEQRGLRALLLPSFICDTVERVCADAGVRLRRYEVGMDLRPCPPEPEEDEPILPDPADPAQPDEPGTIPEKEAD